jgi:hypothetical protein
MGIIDDYLASYGFQKYDPESNPYATILWYRGPTGKDFPGFPDMWINAQRVERSYQSESRVIHIISHYPDSQVWQYDIHSGMHTSAMDYESVHATVQQAIADYQQKAAENEGDVTITEIPQ